MPRKGSRNCFCHHACKQKHVYKNDKVGCDSRNDTEEVIREDDGVEMGESAERERKTVKKNQKVRRKKKRKMRDLK
eukprot:9321380-Ditylum_brightwellii.AAC.1